MYTKNVPVRNERAQLCLQVAINLAEVRGIMKLSTSTALWLSECQVEITRKLSGNLGESYFNNEKRVGIAGADHVAKVG